MKLIDVGKLSISPFEFTIIQELKIEKKLNEHQVLYVLGVVRDEHQFEPLEGAVESTAVVCENDGQTYFCGVLQSVKVTCIEGVFHLEAWAVGATVLLDTVKRKRSFQDNSQSYESIVKAVIADVGGFAVHNSDPVNVENIILQYNETDWEFAKRLASHTNDVLIPITDGRPSFHFGAPDAGGAELETNNYSKSRIFDAIRRFDAFSSVEKGKGAKPLKLTEEGATLYSVETDELLCDIGMKLKLNGASLHVCRLLLSLKNGALAAEYTLCAKQGMSAPKRYNPAITGLVLDGTVTEVENDTLKLKLDDDKERGVEQDTEEAHFFKYATGYSMESHTGWYVMPEEGDTVQLLFPIEDEKYAYAASSLRQEDTDKTANHMVKYLRTSYGKEIKLDEKEILITAKDGETFIQVNEDSGVTINTPHAVNITAGGTMNLKSGKDMTITTDENLTITAKDSVVVNCGGNNIKIDPPSGIAAATDKDVKVEADGNTSLDSKKELSVKSGKDMTIDSGTQLTETAGTLFEMVCSGSAVKMDGNVDIGATLINEN